MERNALVENGMTVKDAINGIRVLASAGWLLDTMRSLRISSASEVMDHLADANMHSLSYLHQQIFTLVDAIYTDLGMTGFHKAVCDASIPVRSDDHTDMDMSEHADCVTKASDQLVQSLKDMLRTNSPIINDTAVVYLKEAVRITQRINLLMMAIKSGPYVDTEE